MQKFLVIIYIWNQIKEIKDITRNNILHFKISQSIFILTPNGVASKIVVLNSTLKLFSISMFDNNIHLFYLLGTRLKGTVIVTVTVGRNFQAAFLKKLKWKLSLCSSNTIFLFIKSGPWLHNMQRKIRGIYIYIYILHNKNI